MKKRGHETTKLKGRNALPIARHRGPTAADLQKQLDLRTRELAEAQKHLAEALEQQVATSGVLQTISSSPGELQPVFEAILENATRLCGAKFGTLYLCDGDAFISATEMPSALRRFTTRLPRSSRLARASCSGRDQVPPSVRRRERNGSLTCSIAWIASPTVSVTRL